MRISRRSCAFSLTIIQSLVIVVLTATFLHAEPQPGDLFREYTYRSPGQDAGGAIRVGGKAGVSHPDRGSDFDYINAWVDFTHSLDLKHAIRAELVVEKILSHNGTKGLAIQWNQSQWMELPTPQAIPEPQHDYYHHTCITVPIDLQHLRDQDDTNRFRLRVSPEQDWGWPQNLIYGVHLRIYYNGSQKEHVSGSITTPEPNSTIGRNVNLAVDIPRRWRRINRVDYLARYRGVNWEGDGQYDRWHYFYYHGNLIHHLGSAVVHPFDCSWDTSWIPDQEGTIEIAARIVDGTGLILMTPAVAGITLNRPGLNVEFCQPKNVPSNWVTRNKAYEQEIDIRGDLNQAVAARLVWSSWSPAYMNGLFINGKKVLQSEGPKYRYYDHHVDLTDLTMLQHGTNLIRTGKTPLYDGKMVHGMEVNWPGIQLLIQYQVKP